MQIKDLMTRDVGLIDPARTISEASRMMKDDDVGVLPVAEDDRLVGMISDRDIVVRAVADGKDPAATPVRDAMSERILCCYEDQSPEDVAANMGENRVRRLPVLNHDKRLVGIVSLGDLSVKGAAGEAGAALGAISQPAR